MLIFAVIFAVTGETQTISRAQNGTYFFYLLNSVNIYIPDTKLY